MLFDGVALSTDNKISYLLSGFNATGQKGAMLGSCSCRPRDVASVGLCPML